jgi:hypothetical protein
MYVDDKIVTEFIKKDRTAQWFRSYLIQAKEEQDQPEPDAVYVPETTPTPTPSYTYVQRIAILLEAYRTRQLFLNRWEYDFLTDNQANPNPTAPQIATVEKFWRRITP